MYVAIGFFGKDKIPSFLSSKSNRYDIAAAVCSGLLVVFCIFDFWGERSLYTFDMKPVYYKELFLAIIVPALFGFVLIRVTYWIKRVAVMRGLYTVFVVIGQITVPIMFLHVPLNHWMQEFGYGRLIYMLIGIVIPVAFSLICCRFKIMRKLFGLNEIMQFK